MSTFMMDQRLIFDIIAISDLIIMINDSDLDCGAIK